MLDDLDLVTGGLGLGGRLVCRPVVHNQHLRALHLVVFQAGQQTLEDFLYGGGLIIRRYYYTKIDDSPSFAAANSIIPFLGTTAIPGAVDFPFWHDNWGTKKSGFLTYWLRYSI
jgi:hypothetical protein